MELTPIPERGLERADIHEAFARFLRLNVAQGDASPHTIRAYYSRVRPFVAWCEGEGIDPALSSEEDILRYRAHLVEEGYARATIGSRLSALRQFYAAAVWRGLRPDNPAEGVKAPADRTAPEERIKYVPLEGFKRLLEAPDASTPKGRRDRAILVLMALHGLRVAEVASLTIDDYRAGQPSWVTVNGKGGKARQVYLTARTQAQLVEWLAAREAGPGVRAIFTTLARRVKGTALGTRGLRRVVDGYLGRLDLKEEGVSCHSLRHSFATWSLMGGAKLLSISAALGHSSIETTQTYAKVVDRVRENPTVFLERLMG